MTKCVCVFICCFILQGIAVVKQVLLLHQCDKSKAMQVVTNGGSVVNCVCMCEGVYLCVCVCSAHKLSFPLHCPCFVLLCSLMLKEKKLSTAEDREREKEERERERKTTVTFSRLMKEGINEWVVTLK